MKCELHVHILIISGIEVKSKEEDIFDLNAKEKIPKRLSQGKR